MKGMPNNIQHDAFCGVELAHFESNIFHRKQIKLLKLQCYSTSREANKSIEKSFKVRYEHQINYILYIKFKRLKSRDTHVAQDNNTKFRLL